MFPSRYTSYLELNYNPIERIQIFLDNKYIFTIGAYKKEMGFFIDFPNFNRCESTISDYILPKGKKYLDKVEPKNFEKNICPKLSFHESGMVLLSRTGMIFNKEISRKAIRDSIYKNDGCHVFTISIQNASKLGDEPYIVKNKVEHISLPFRPIPYAIKFVGNLWKESDLKKCLDCFSAIKNRMDMPITWPRKDGSGLSDIIFIVKLCHLKKAPAMYLTVRCMPIPYLDKDYNSGPLLFLLSGLSIEELDNLNVDSKIFGFISRN